MNKGLVVPSLGGLLTAVAVIILLAAGYNVPLTPAVVIGLLSGAGMQAGLRVFWFRLEPR